MGGLATHLTEEDHPRWRPGLGRALAAVCWFVAGLARSRLLFEGAFPAWPLLGRPSGALGLAAIVTVLGTAGVTVLRDKELWTRLPLTAAFLPLLINILWLIDPAVDPARGRFLFAAGLWLAAAPPAWVALGDVHRRWQRPAPPLAVACLRAGAPAT